MNIFRATLAQQRKDFQALAARVEEQAVQIQKVTRLKRVEVSKPIPRVVASNQ